MEHPIIGDGYLLWPVFTPFVAAMAAVASAPWRETRPLRRYLRRRNVVTLFAAAALVLGVAVVLVVIGLGEGQISAIDHVRESLYRNWYFDAGLFFTAVAISVGVIAMSANSSQARSRVELDEALRLLD